MYYLDRFLTDRPEVTEVRLETFFVGVLGLTLDGLGLAGMVRLVAVGFRDNADSLDDLDLDSPGNLVRPVSRTLGMVLLTTVGSSMTWKSDSLR